MLKRIPLVLVLAFTFACSESAIEPASQSPDQVAAAPSFDMGGNEVGVQFLDVPFNGVALNNGTPTRCVGLFLDGQDINDFLRTNKDGTSTLYVSEQPAAVWIQQFDFGLPGWVVTAAGEGRWSMHSGWAPPFAPPTTMHVGGRVTDVSAPYDVHRVVCVFDSEEGNNFLRIDRTLYGVSTD
jgi:hypothetical protein